ncbi:MAG: hypothetical protein LBN39_02590 [Planctomycetaceae bacterium]|jgi:hypothetical protein|nr:hypothetical protein [Planctomycetaceae bacterium]
MKHLFFSAVLFLFAGLTALAEELPLPAANGTYTGTDALGRVLPDSTAAPAVRKERHVGLFYFLWMAQHGKAGPYDVNKIVAEHPDAIKDGDDPAWGPINAFHHWGESLYGYYSSEDAWVMRKHVQLLTDAGVDFLVFDATNAFHYPVPSFTMLKILDEYQKQGWNVPKVVYYTNSSSGQTAERIYKDIYSHTEYKNLWFYWEGKPLIIAQPDECSAEVKNFFRIKKSQWPNEGKFYDDGFPWIAFERPQHVFKNAKGENEVINVSVAQHSGTIRFSSSAFYGDQTNWTRSWHGGKNDPAKDAYLYGYNIGEQFDYAIKQDPKIIFITGWNEWVAMRFKNMVPNEPVGFVDLCDTNNSRDIEPMKGGFFDNYYMQMIADIRRYKGTFSPGGYAAGEKTYRDYTNDIIDRDAPGYGNLVYKNTTGLNDFDTFKVSFDENNIYFDVQTVKPVQKANDENRMMLYLHIPGSAKKEQPELYGYHYVTNRISTDGDFAAVECPNGKQWVKSGKAERKIDGNKMRITVGRSLIGLKDKPVSLQFKWSDTPEMRGTETFYTDGDAAPLGRVNYVFTEK